MNFCRFCCSLLKSTELYWNVLGDLLSSLELSETSLSFAIWSCCIGNMVLCSTECKKKKSMTPTWLIISSTPSSYLLQLSPSTSTPWKLGIKSGDGEGIICCLQLCSAGLFRHIRLKPPFPERQQWRIVAGAVQDWGVQTGPAVREGCCDEDLLEQINQTSEKWQKKKPEGYICIAFCRQT